MREYAPNDFNDFNDLNDFNNPKALNDLIYHQVLPLKSSPFRLPESSKRERANNKKEVLQKLLLLKDLSLKKNGGDLLSHS